MSEGWHDVTLSEADANPEKPGLRWEVSPQLGIDAFNFNVAVLDPGDRLSQNHYHYHEDQEELFYLVAGRCRVEAHADSFTMESDDVVHFEDGRAGAHLLHNPFDEPCKLVAVGWPPEGRYPVHQLETTESVLAERRG